MQPLEPGLSFIAQRYLNHVDLNLTRHIHHYRKLGNNQPTSSIRQYYSLLADQLQLFQNLVPVEQRAVLTVNESAEDLLRFNSVYRLVESGPPAQLVEFQLERSPMQHQVDNSDLGSPVILKKALEDRPHLSLTCLLKPVVGLMEALSAAGWKTIADANTGKVAFTALTDGKVIAYITTNLEAFEEDTLAIQEYHANKGKTDD